ncbi:MAG TPA: Abi-alpha family protein [Stellaceae bacterium]|nr:Abi-alpha family protein [Stellaceae bacterium]
MDAIILKPVVEIAKSGAKSIDPARDLCGFVARVLGTVPEDVVGIVAGDPMRQVRTRNCIRLAHRTGEILAGRGVKETVALSATIALPLLAAAQDEGREEMQEMWARMLANAMSPAKAETMRLEFVDALRRLHPRDTQILQKMSESTAQLGPSSRDHFAGRLKISVHAADVALHNLERVRCIKPGGPGSLSYYMTAFGHELIGACTV